MPIPKPKAGEPKNAYIKRCTTGGANPGECNVAWKESHLTADNLYTLDAEILAAGEWSVSVGGKVKITAAHIDQAVNNFRALRSLVDVPLKFGHNPEQKMTDGMPALGWVDDVWVKSGKVMARFVDMPQIVFEAIKAKRYKNVSIEGLFDVKHKDKEYGFVLTAVALLGVDMPAVNTLNDLQTYLSASNDLQFASAVNFSINDEGESQMTPEEIAALQTRLADAEAKNITLTAENTVAKTAAEAAETLRINSEAAVALTAQITELTTTGEKLVKEGKATPAQRDLVLKDLDAKGIAFATATFAALALGTGNGMKEGDQGKEGESDDKKNEGKAPDEILHAKTMAFSAKHGCEYDVANDAVMAENPELARDYADMTGTNG